MNLLEMTFSGGIMIVVITVLRAVFLNKFPKKTFLYLWEIAMLRLILPFSIPAVTSIYSLFSAFGNSQETVKNSPEITVKNIHSVENIFTENDLKITENSISQNVPTENSVSIQLVIWIAGMIIVFTFFIVGYVAVYRKYRYATIIRGGYIDEWLSEQKLHRKIKTFRSECTLSPLTYGIFCPVILLPESIENQKSEQLTYILNHEITHIRRFDILRKIMAAAVLCVHWFNPVVWVLFLLYNRDIELVCDETVVKKMGSDCRSSYAVALIHMAEHHKGLSALYSHFSKNAIEERIVSIMKFRKFSISTAITATVVVLGIITTFATSAAQNEDENKSVTLNQGNTNISAPDVEWWTYEDYKDWLDNEKIELQEMLGEKGWTGGRGDFIWTQEVIDETIAMYEDILEQIKSGAKISKTVDGSDDIMLMQSTPIDSLNEINNKEIIDKFGSFGISFDDDKMLYNGEEVRLFFDGTEISDGYVTRYVYYNENGTADITTEYEPTPNADGSNDPFGKLIGLRKATEEEFKSVNFGYNSEEITLESITIADTFEVDKSVEAIITNYADEYTVTEGDFEDDGKTLAEIFAPLEKYGVKYDEENNVLYYNEKIVNKFYDLSPDGSVFSFSTDKGGEICIKTVYDEEGQLSKVEETAFMYESDLRC